MTAPPENARRFPNLPLTRPVPLAAIIEEATKAVVGQLIRLAPPNSATMLGRSVAVINTFIECRSTPPHKTQRGRTTGHTLSRGERPHPQRSTAICGRRTGSLMTRCWREMDSNRLSLAEFGNFDVSRTSRQALLPFRSLDPFRALREPDCRRRDGERFSRFEQRTGTNQKTTTSQEKPHTSSNPAPSASRSLYLEDPVGAWRMCGSSGDLIMTMSSTDNPKALVVRFRPAAGNVT